MDFADISKTVALLKAAGAPTADLEALAGYIINVAPQVGLAFVAQNKSSKGLVMPLFIQDIREKITPATADKPAKVRFEVHVVVPPFDDVVIPPDLGNKISRFEIEVFIETKIRMTPTRQAAYLAGLSAADRNGFAGNRKYDTFRTDSIRLVSGTKMKLTAWDGMFAHSNGVPFSVGEFAVAKGLFVEDKYMSSDEPSKYGKQWSLNKKTGGLEDDPMHTGPESLMQLFHALETGNVLLNVANTNPQFKIENESPADKAFRVKREMSEKGPEGWAKEAILTKWLPEALQPFAKRLLVVPLDGTIPAGRMQKHHVDLMALRKKVFIAKPIWSPDFLSKADEPKKVAAFQTRCQILEEDLPPQLALLTVQIYEENLARYGIVNQELFVALAGSYIPKCEGMIAAMPSLSNSHTMNESSAAFNKPSADGVYPMGVAFGVTAYAEVFCVDLASGIIKGGYHISPACASAVLIHKYKTDDFTVHCPPDVALYASQNKLNTGGKPPEVNLFESRQTSIVEMKGHYQFIFMSEKATDAEDMKELMEALTTLYPAELIDKTSALILGEKVKGVEGWPVKIKASTLKYTIFAIRNDVAAAHFEKQAAPPALSEEEFVAAYVEALQKRKADEAHALMIANELAAINDLPAGALDGPGVQKLLENSPPKDDTPFNVNVPQPDLPVQAAATEAASEKRPAEEPTAQKRQKIAPVDPEMTDPDEPKGIEDVVAGDEVSESEPAKTVKTTRKKSKQAASENESEADTHADAKQKHRPGPAKSALSHIERALGKSAGHKSKPAQSSDQEDPKSRHSKKSFDLPL